MSAGDHDIGGAIAKFEEMQTWWHGSLVVVTSVAKSTLPREFERHIRTVLFRGFSALDVVFFLRSAYLLTGYTPQLRTTNGKRLAILFR